MGVKTFYKGKYLLDPKRTTVMFLEPNNFLNETYNNLEKKSIVETSGYIYEGTKIHRWISK